MTKFNLGVIGAGSGGLVSAAGAAGLGAKVVLIEKHKMGGDCLNTGCVPSKALIKSAKVAHLLKHATDYGVKADGVAVDFAAVMARVHSIIKQIEPHDSPERFRTLGVQVEFGEGHFISPHEISDGKNTFYAKKIVIATGSRPMIPEIPGLNLSDVLTSENLWELKELPKRLLVVGAGPIGIELAQCFHRFGSKVTVIGNTDRILARDDEEAAALVLKRLQTEGVDFCLKATASKVEGKRLSATVDGQTKTFDFDKILIAAGRLPNIEGLKLENAGVEFNKKGVIVDNKLRTKNHNIFAVGDVAGPYLFTHMADYQARTVIRNALFPGSSSVDYRVVPWCTYSDPELGQVGITEKIAKEQGAAYDVTRYDLKNLDRAICDGNNVGFVKVLTQKGKDQILGATIVGEHAGDLLHEFVLAMKKNIGLQAIAGTTHAYPTLAEGPKRSADEWMRRKLTPKTKAILTKYFSWCRR